jgi:hypothetical protein
VNFPAGPLYAFVPQGIYGHNNEGLAATLGLSVKAVRKWQTRGLCTLQADEVAIRLGVHPSAIWNDWFDSITDEPMCKWCGQRTIGAVNCSKRCEYLLALERKRIATATRKWWVRIDRYRELVHTPHTSFTQEEGLPVHRTTVSPYIEETREVA